MQSKTNRSEAALSSHELTYTHTRKQKKECVVVVVVCVLLLFLLFVRRGSIYSARSNREGPARCDGREASPFEDDDFFFFDALVLDHEKERGEYKCANKKNKKESPRKERGKPIDDATLATPRARRRRKRANVAFASVPCEGKTHGRVETFFQRELYIPRKFSVLTNEFFSSSLSLSLSSLSH